MKCKINYLEKLNPSLDFCLSKLPLSIKEQLQKFIDNSPYNSINEIRLHKNSYISLIINSKNVKTDVFVNAESLNIIFENMCDNSLYAHFDTIKQGYISVGHGIRAGICGKASVDNGEICGIYDVSSINVRIPNRIQNASKFLFELLKENNFDVSVLLYSSPGVGKTTILKDLIYKLINETEKRFAVVDTREELTSFIETPNNADFFIGYPKGTAIQLATKSMTPQIIICDEISSKSEADEILFSGNVGVNLIATTHANDFEELLSKAILDNIFKNKIFDFALGIKRNDGERKYKFSLNKL